MGQAGARRVDEGRRQRHPQCGQLPHPIQERQGRGRHPVESAYGASVDADMAQNNSKNEGAPFARY